MDPTNEEHDKKIELMRARVQLAIQRIVLNFATTHHSGSLTAAQRDQANIDVEGARAADQEIADQLGDETGDGKDDFFPSLTMKTSCGSGVNQIVMFCGAPRKKFALAGELDPKTWKNIREWMNHIFGQARGFWQTWRSQFGCDLEMRFNSDIMMLEFGSNTTKCLGFHVVALDKEGEGARAE